MLQVLKERAAQAIKGQRALKGNQVRVKEQPALRAALGRKAGPDRRANQVHHKALPEPKGGQAHKVRAERHKEPRELKEEPADRVRAVPKDNLERLRERQVLRAAQVPKDSPVLAKAQLVAKGVQEHKEALEHRVNLAPPKEPLVVKAAVGRKAVAVLRGHLALHKEQLEHRVVPERRGRVAHRREQQGLRAVLAHRERVGQVKALLEHKGRLEVVRRGEQAHKEHQEHPKVLQERKELQVLVAKVVRVLKALVAPLRGQVALRVEPELKVRNFNGNLHGVLLLNMS